jgi:hypothetical protein
VHEIDGKALNAKEIICTYGEDLMPLRYFKKAINAVGTENLKNAIPQSKAPLLKTVSKRQYNIRNKLMLL